MSTSGGMPFAAPGRSYRGVQALVAGVTTITHNLGNSAVQVDVRDNSTGDVIDCIVLEPSSTTCTITVGIAVASARITIQS